MPNSIAWTIMKTIEAICSRVHMIVALPIDRENAPRDRLCAGEGSPGVPCGPALAAHCMAALMALALASDAGRGCRARCWRAGRGRVTLALMRADVTVMLVKAHPINQSDNDTPSS